jgi:hypothetical protein
VIRPRGTAALLVALCTVAVTIAGAVTTAGAATWDVNRRLRDARIDESSGLVSSRQHRRVLWTHNDSGDSARVFAVGRRGLTRAVVSLRGIRPRDIEALTIRRAPRGTYLYAADIGDNRLRRSEIAIYKFREPETLRSMSVKARTWRLRYPDGRHNAEAFLYDKGSGRFFVVTKSPSGGRIYRVPRSANDSGLHTLRYVGRAPERITDGAFLNNGRMVLRSHTKAYISNGPGTAVTRVVALPSQPQGESLAADQERRRGPGSGSEGSNSLVYRVTP